MELRDMTKEQLVYHLGQMVKMPLKSTEIEQEIDKILAEMIERGTLIETDLCGNGWRVIGEDGANLMPGYASDFVFAEKGYAFLYWLSSGRQYDAKLMCISDPLEEEKKLQGYQGEKIQDDDVYVVHEPPKLTLVKN